MLVKILVPVKISHYYVARKHLDETLLKELQRTAIVWFETRNLLSTEISFVELFILIVWQLVI